MVYFLAYVVELSRAERPDGEWIAVQCGDGWFLNVGMRVLIQRGMETVTWFHIRVVYLEISVVRSLQFFATCWRPLFTPGGVRHFEILL